MEDLWLTVEDTGNRAEWRRRTRVADPSPEGFTERERGGERTEKKGEGKGGKGREEKERPAIPGSTTARDESRNESMKAV